MYNLLDLIFEKFWGYVLRILEEY